MEYAEEEKLLQMRSRNEFGVMAIKYAVIINGGAAIAITSLLGAISAKAPSEKLVFSLTHLSPVVLFALGVLSGALSAAFANLSQHDFLEGKIVSATCYQRMAFGAVGAGYVLFFVGILCAFFAYVPLQ